MAWGETLATPAIANAADASSYATASWTPTANRLIVAFVAWTIGASPVAPTGSGNGITWEKVVESLGANHGTAWYFGKSGASPSAGATTFSFGGVTQTGCHIHVIEVDGAFITGPNAAAALAQSTVSGQGAQASPWSTTFGTAPFSQSRCMVGVYINVNTAMTPRASWTELGDNGHATPASRVETQWRSDASEQTVSVSGWAGNVQARLIGIEIVAAAIPVSDSDTGSGTDGQTAAAASFTGTDTGAGTDGQTAAASTFTTTEAGTGTEAASIAATTSSSDTGTDLETGSVTNNATSADVSSGADAQTPAAATLPGADTGSSTDNGANAAALAATETGSGADTGASTTTTAGAETGTGADMPVRIGLADTDAGASVDIGSVGDTPITDSESGSAADNQTATATPQSAETGAVIDTGSVNALAAAGDGASGADSAIPAAASLSAVELAVLAEAEMIVNAALAADTATGTDAVLSIQSVRDIIILVGLLQRFRSAATLERFRSARSLARDRAADLLER